MGEELEPKVIVTESGNGPYAQFVTAGRHVMGADEPERFGGHDTGPSPYEYLLAGLGACTAMTVRMYAARHAWKLDRVSVELRHDKVALEGAASKTDRFERVIHLEGDLADEQRAKLLDVAERCPVSQTLTRPSVIVTRSG